MIATPAPLPDDCIGTFDVPVWRVGNREPQGVALAASDGRIGGHPVEITVTMNEIHLRILTRGECFALDLQAVSQRAFDVVEADGKARGLIR